MQTSKARQWGIPLGAVLTIAAIMAARQPSMFTDPRFWAEEAGFFYARFLNESAFSALKYAHLGSYQLLANLMVLLATKVPVWMAPAVTTYLAFGVLVVLAWQLGIFIREYQIGAVGAALLLVGFSLQWGMYEVALSATNVQWIAGLSALMVLALPPAWLDRNPRSACLWLLVCGLSGIPAALCAPAFALKAYLCRSRSTAMAAGILFLCAAVQAVCVLVLGTPGREFGKSWVVLLMPTLMQTAIGPFTGPEPLFLLGTYINGGLPKVGMLLVATAAAGAGLVALTAALARDAVKDRIVWILLSAWLYVSMIQTVGALHPAQLVAASGARYYVFGATAMLLLLALASTNENSGPRAMAVGALALVCLAGVSQRLVGDWTHSMVTGPSWKRQVQACKPDQRCTVHAWPNDGTFYLIIDGGRVQSSYYPTRLPGLAPAPF